MDRYRILIRLLLLCIFPFRVYAGDTLPARTDADGTVWFTAPATDWASQSLHIGNGYMGASFYGDVRQERFDIAEKTFWAGGPYSVPDFNFGIRSGGKDRIADIRKAVLDRKYTVADSLATLYLTGDYSGYGYFSMVGNLLIDFPGMTSPVENYIRGIDLSSSLGFVRYTSGGVAFSREYFCSYPDRLMSLHFSADRKGVISFDLSHGLLYAPDEIIAEEGGLAFSGLIPENGLEYTVRIRILHEGGRVSVNPGSGISVREADEATVFYTVDTEYAPVYPSYKGEDPDLNTRETISRAVEKGYAAVRSDHISDYRKLYDRVRLTLKGDSESEVLPTDVRIAQLKHGFTDDSSLKALWFNFSRYLLISASRQGTLPSTLQGVWNTYSRAPWSGNFQSNINVEEMYWGCGPVRLPECGEGYAEWIEGLVEPGRRTAAEYYGTGGWVSHSTGNIWGHTVPGSDILWGLYPCGAAWHCRYMWEHFAFTRDTVFLRERAYPVMKEAAEFWLENMVEYGDHYIIAPSVSAEHGIEMHGDAPAPYSVTNGEVVAGKVFTVPAFQDIEMVYDLYTNVILASGILGVDRDFRKEVRRARDRLMPLRTGRYGQLQEWIEDVDNPRDHHRHLSHLYALYPGSMITPSRTPHLADAARKSLEMRGSGKFGDRWPHSGGNWSMAWRTALWTRLYDGDRAMDTFNRMIRDSGYGNMMSGQSGVMQVDATMATSGLFAEMLLQSHEGFLHLLPALPTEWPEGRVEGLAARNGYIVNMEWKYGKLVKAEIFVPDMKRLPDVRIQGMPLSRDNRGTVTFRQ